MTNGGKPNAVAITDDLEQRWTRAEAHGQVVLERLDPRSGPGRGVVYARLPFAEAVSMFTAMCTGAPEMDTEQLAAARAKVQALFDGRWEDLVWRT